MLNLIERIVNDRYFNYLIGLSAYFFLIILILNTTDRDSAIVQGLFLTGIFALIVRIVYLVFNRKMQQKCPDDTPATIVFRNTIIAIGYLALIAIILGDKFRFIWMVYALIVLRICMAVLTGIRLKKK